MRTKSIKTCLVIVLITCILLAFNTKVPTKKGIDYKVTVYKIPLYIKIIEFIDRDYRYRALAKEIMTGMNNDKAKVMAILKWTRNNIKTDIPENWPVYDDHILNIIIRGYGTEDQISDVFTALCMYAGIPAGWAKLEIRGSENKLAVSFVNIDGKWRVFDVYRNTLFLNNSGDMASVEDVASGNYKKEGIAKYIDNTTFTYDDYFVDLDKQLNDVTLRSKKQMPFQRLIYETANVFNDNRKK